MQRSMYCHAFKLKPELLAGSEGSGTEERPQEAQFHKLESNTAPRSLYIFADLCGVEVRCLIDMGAQANIMAPEVWGELQKARSNLPALQPSGCKLLNFN